MKSYLVQWSIEIDAESPREAAEKAREIQLDPESIATVFEVVEYENNWEEPRFKTFKLATRKTIDLEEGDHE